MSSKKITYERLSELSGVSVSTVSRVINNKDLVNSETYLRVKKAMDELQYVPAKPKAFTETEHMKVFVLNIPNIENPFYSDMVRGMKDFARLHGYRVFVDEGLINRESLSYYQSLLREPLVCGPMTAWYVQEEIIQSLNEIAPVVQCAEYNPKAGLPYVEFDDKAATRSLVTHLIAQGRRSIAIINGPLGARFAQARFEVCLQVLEEANIKPNPDWIISLPIIEFNMVLSKFTAIFQNTSIPDAVVANSDYNAAAVIKAASRCGLRVPQDIMVTGFDNIPLSYMMTPTITTIAPPSYQLGYVGTELLVSRIRDPQLPVQCLSLDAELLVRESTSQNFQ